MNVQTIIQYLIQYKQNIKYNDFSLAYIFSYSNANKIMNLWISHKSTTIFNYEIYGNEIQLNYNSSTITTKSKVLTKIYSEEELFQLQCSDPNLHDCILIVQAIKKYTGVPI